VRICSSREVEDRKWEKVDVVICRVFSLWDGVCGLQRCYELRKPILTLPKSDERAFAIAVLQRIKYLHTEG
jgi:hypothetical protein